MDKSIWSNWTSSLSDTERMNLDNLLHTRRINISHDKLNANVPRKVVKIKKTNIVPGMTPSSIMDTQNNQ